MHVAFESRLPRTGMWAPFKKIGTCVVTGLINAAVLAILIYIAVKTWRDAFDVGMDKPGIYSAFAIGFQVVYNFATIAFYIPKNELYRAAFYSYIFISIVTILPFSMSFSFFTDTTVETMKNFSAVNWRINVGFMEFEDDNNCIGYGRGYDLVQQNGKEFCDTKFDNNLKDYYDKYRILFIVAFVLNIASILLNAGYQLIRRICKCMDFNVQL